MAKPKSPILSLGARGTVGDAVTFQRIHHTNIARAKPVPTDPQSDLQLDRRSLFGCVRYLWHSLTAAEKLQWRFDATRHRLTGYNLFLREYLTLLADPLLLLPFAHGRGATTYDYSQNRHHGTIFGALWRQGDYKPYLLFDNLDDKVQLPLNAVDLGIANSGGIEACITPTGAGARAILMDYNPGVSKGLYLRVIADNTVNYQARDAGISFNIASTRTLTMGQKYTIRAYHTGTAAYLYVDGELWGTSPQVGAIGVSPDNLTVGRRSYDNVLAFGGNIHYLVVYQLP